MKWIGQHIWDFISRFRSDVYLEDLDNSIEKCTLVVDGDGKVYKNCDRRNVTGTTTDGIVTYKDDDEVKVSEELKLTGSSSAVLQSTNGTFHIKGAGVDGDDGKNLLLYGGDVLNNPTDKDGGDVKIYPGKSTGDNDDSKVSIYTNTPRSSSDGTDQVQRENFLFYGNRKTQNGSVRDFKTFLIDNVINGREATIEMREDTGDTYFRTWPNPYNTSGYPAGEIIFEPGKNGANKPIGDARFNSSGKFKFSEGAYSSMATYGFVQFAGKEMTIGTVDNSGSLGHLNISPNGSTKITSSLYSESIYVGDNRKIYFTGDTDNTTRTSLYVVDPTSTNSILLPDASGTVALTSQLDHDSLTNFVTNEHIDWTSASAGTIHATNYSNDNDDVSIANLKTKLAGGFASNAVSIGDTDDTVTIPGNLTVSGTTTTINTTNLNVEDKNITLNYHPTNDTSSSADGAGITVQDGINATNDVAITWNGLDNVWTTDQPFRSKNLQAKRTELMLNTDGASSGEMLTLISNSSGSNKGITFPNATGTMALTSDRTKRLMSINPGAYGRYFYLQWGSTWFPIRTDFVLQYGIGSTPNLTTTGSTLANQARAPLMVAISDMKIYKVHFNWYWTAKSGSIVGTRNFEFSFHDATVLNDSIVEQTLSSAIVVTNNNGSFTNDKAYTTTWEFASGNGYTLSAGKALYMFLRCTSFNHGTSLFIPTLGEMSLEYEYV